MSLNSAVCMANSKYLDQTPRSVAPDLVYTIYKSLSVPMLRNIMVDTEFANVFHICLVNLTFVLIKPVSSCELT